MLLMRGGDTFKRGESKEHRSTRDPQGSSVYGEPLFFSFSPYFSPKVVLLRCVSLGPHGLYPARLLCSWDSPGKNTGVGSLSLLQEFFLTQDLNPCLQHCCRFCAISATRGAQEYCSGWPIPSPGDLADPGIEPGSPAWQAVSLLAGLPGEPQSYI